MGFSPTVVVPCSSPIRPWDGTYRHDSPYTYFSSKELHSGEISLECSRAGAAAVALWATQKLLPLTPGGTFAEMLAGGRRAALDLYRRLSADNRFVCGAPPDLDIVVWAVRARSVSEGSDLAQKIFDAALTRDLHLALATLPVNAVPLVQAGIKCDAEDVRCLRSVLMKPEHEAWVDQIWSRLSESAREVLGKPG